MTIDEVLTDWRGYAAMRLAPSTVDTYGYWVQRILYDIGKPLDLIDFEDLERIARTYPAPSYHMVRGSIRHLFAYANRKGWVQGNPTDDMPKAPKPDRVPECLTRYEVKQLLQAASSIIYDQRPRWVLQLYYATGARLAEGIGIDPRTDLVDGMESVVLRRTKRRPGQQPKERSIPLSDMGKEAVSILLTGYPHGERDGLMGCSRKQVQSWMREAGLRAHLPERKRHVHILRHSFCTHLIEAGVDPFTVKELAGHASLDMTMRYVSVVDEGKRRAVSALSV